MTPAIFMVIWLLLYGVIATCLVLRLRQDAPEVVRVTVFASVMSFGIFGLIAMTERGYRGELSFLVAAVSVIVGGYLSLKYQPIEKNE